MWRKINFCKLKASPVISITLTRIIAWSNDARKGSNSKEKQSCRRAEKSVSSCKSANLSRKHARLSIIAFARASKDFATRHNNRCRCLPSPLAHFLPYAHQSELTQSVCSRRRRLNCRSLFPRAHVHRASEDVHMEIRGFKVSGRSETRYAGYGITRKKSGVERSGIFVEAVYVTPVADPFQTFALVEIG